MFHWKLGRRFAWQSVYSLHFPVILIADAVIVPAGGLVGEAVANYFTIRNGGIREPEHRLPAIAISLITAPLGLLLYGAGLQYKMSFMVPVVGLSLCKCFDKSCAWPCKLLTSESVVLG
jgi:hypothetical protein